MTRPLLLGSLVFSLLACAGLGNLMGYGEVLARQPAPSGQPFRLTYTPRSSAPHHLWFELELDAPGAYRVEGSLTVGGPWRE